VPATSVHEAVRAVPAVRVRYGDRMSIAVPIPQLFDQVGGWGFGYLLTVSDDGRAHLLALHPVVRGQDDERVLRFDAGGGRACRNASARPQVTIVFPPGPGGDGMSLVVDGHASVDGDHVDVVPTGAVLHRPAPPVG
jgi:hypothetical protein